jgi:hypothetical protein
VLPAIESDHLHKPPRSVAVAHALILLGALIWFLFAILLALNAHAAFPNDPLIRSVMAVLSAAAGFVTLVLLYLLRQRSRLAYFGMLVALAAAALALFFDDVGLVDLLFLAITIIPIGLLVRDRAWYLRPRV